MSYSRQPCPVWLFTDLEGNILDDTYYISFLENTIPYLPQPVFHDDQGINPWSNPLEFYPDGTLPDNLYFEDGAVYRLEIRQGPTQSDPLIRLIENFVAGGASTPVDLATPTDNQITNPQFAEISFPETLVISNSGNNTYNIAPGWFLDLSSSGTAVLTLTRTAVVGNSNIPTDIPTNPSYVLNFAITSGTFTSVNLRQRFDHAPAIWASGGVSVCFTGKMLTNHADITVQYIPSSGTGERTIINTELGNVYEFVTGSITLDPSDSTDTGANGFVDIVFTLPIADTCSLTNIQVIGSPVEASFSYEQTTVERQIDQMFHYYKPLLEYKPIPSYLVGWDFPLNPAQALGATVSARTFGADNRAGYIWDQTVVFQGKDTTFDYGRDTNTGGFVVNNAIRSSNFALIQYLSGNQLFDLLGQRLSAQLKGFVTGASIKGTLSLYWKAGSVDALPASVVSSIAANGIPTVTAGWNAVPNENYGINVAFTLTSTETVFDFTGFDATAVDTHTATSFAIVVAFDTMASGNAAVFDYISLMGGDIATRPAPQTPDEVLRQCEYYYEKSYPVAIVPGTASSFDNSIVADMLAVISGSDVDAIGRAFNFDYKQVKRVTNPTITFYSPDGGASNQAHVYLIQNGVDKGNTDLTTGFSTQFTLFAKGDSAASYYPANETSICPAFTPSGSPSTYPDTFMNFHYTVDARLGVI